MITLVHILCCYYSCYISITIQQKSVLWKGHTPLIFNKVVTLLIPPQTQRGWGYIGVSVQVARLVSLLFFPCPDDTSRKNLWIQIIYFVQRYITKKQRSSFNLEYFDSYGHQTIGFELNVISFGLMNSPAMLLQITVSAL